LGHSELLRLLLARNSSHFNQVASRRAFVKHTPNKNEQRLYQLSLRVTTENRRLRQAIADAAEVINRMEAAEGPAPGAGATSPRKRRQRGQANEYSQQPGRRTLTSLHNAAQVNLVAQWAAEASVNRFRPHILQCICAGDLLDAGAAGHGAAD
jgi:hypothetical protein